MRFSFASVVILNLSFLVVTGQLNETGPIEKFLSFPTLSEQVESEWEREGDFYQALANSYNWEDRESWYPLLSKETISEINRWGETELRIIFCCFNL